MSCRFRFRCASVTSLLVLLLFRFYFMSTTNSRQYVPSAHILTKDKSRDTIIKDVVLKEDMSFNILTTLESTSRKMESLRTILKTNKTSPFPTNMTSQGKNITSKHLSFSRYLINTTSQQKLFTSEFVLNASEEYLVPNIVHFIWFGRHRKIWEFHQFLSVLSAYKNINPDVIYLHCDQEPFGNYWTELKTKVKTLKIVITDPPTEIFNTYILYPEHHSDVYRILILQKMGGIYLDTDVLALKSFNPLRKYNFTMGIEYHGNPGRLNNGVIISAPNATFLNIWLDTYRTFKTLEWDHHSCVVPYRLRLKYPRLIHVEEKSINYPSGKKRHMIWLERYDWSRNYAMHLWFRQDKLTYDPHLIKSANTTFGEMARFIYYNDSKNIP